MRSERLIEVTPSDRRADSSDAGDWFSRRMGAPLALLAASGAPLGPLRLKTLLTIRWLAVGGQLTTILVVQTSLGISLPIGLIAPLIVASALINLALHHLPSTGFRLTERAALALMLYDVLQLTLLLALTGGLNNPFAALMTLPVMLGAATLSFASAGAILTLTCVALAALLTLPAGLPWTDGVLELPRLYRIAIWISLTLASILIAAYAWRLAEDSRRMSAALAATQAALSREQELSAIGGIAAAAAHELGSPLAAIAVGAKEIWRDLPMDSPLREEAEIVLAQAQRCREILQSLSHKGADDREHAPFLRAPLARLITEVAHETALPGVDFEMRIECEDGVDPPDLRLPIAVRHGLLNLFENAFEFASDRVVCTAFWRADALVLRIDDDGPGFAPEVLDGLGEPYRSSRRKQGGLGLGVFIAVTLLARSGGAVHFANNERGARVEITWRGPDLARLWMETYDHD